MRRVFGIVSEIVVYQKTVRSRRVKICHRSSLVEQQESAHKVTLRKSGHLPAEIVVVRQAGVKQPLLIGAGCQFRRESVELQHLARRFVRSPVDLTAAKLPVRTDLSNETRA